MGRMVSATEFKAKCLALIDEMQRSGEPLTVTRRGKVSVTLTTDQPESSDVGDVFGCMAGTGHIVGDLDEPLDPHWEEKWVADWDAQMRIEPE